MRIKEFREYQRLLALQYQQEDPGIRNPQVSGMLDKTTPITSEEKALALGFEATGPKRWLDLPPGDAGCGESMFRLSHTFYQLNGNINPFGLPGLDRPAFAPYSRAIAIATQRSADQKPRYWHISIYGIGVRRPGSRDPQSPLSLSELESRKFESIYALTAGTETDLTPRFIPSIPTCQARILVHDESGGRYVDVDVLGTRSMSVYGFGATVFLLIKPIGYEVDPSNTGNNEPLESEIGFEDDLVGARILPVKTNTTQNRSQRTITVITVASGGTRTSVPIPPGALTVQVFNHDSPATAALWSIVFNYNRIAPGIRSDLGFIDMIPGLSRSRVIEIPNAPAIQFGSAPNNPPTQWSIVFEVAP